MPLSGDKTNPLGSLRKTQPKALRRRDFPLPTGVGSPSYTRLHLELPIASAVTLVPHTFGD
jgi:hypothetical protein